MKNREELQNSIFEKSAIMVRKRIRRRKKAGVLMAGLFLLTGIGIYLLKNVSGRNHEVQEIQLAGKETQGKQTLAVENNTENSDKKNDIFENPADSNVILVSEAAKKIAERTNLSEKFIQHTADFSIELFQKSFQKKQKENIMISPLSALLVLSMAANGADNETLLEMESVLGGELGIKEINENLNSLMTGLYNGQKTKLFAADSIWVRNDDNQFIINPEFLDINRKYYYADSYVRPFNQATIREMNQWISEKTEGMFEDIISEIPANTVMYLFNTMIFQGEWQKVYCEDEVREGTFIGYNGKEEKAFMMYSTEGIYLNTENAKGFIKPYENGYSFVALLPEEEIDIGEFIQSLNGEKFLKIIEEAEDSDNIKFSGVSAALPKFSSRTCAEMQEILQEMGIKQAFAGEKADFSKMEKMSRKNTYISRIIQNSYINVDETGTQAGAVTQVAVDGKGISQLEVILNRPFVYAVIDNETKLPVYIGAMLNIEE